MHCCFRQWMPMSDMNFCHSFWILTRGVKRRACVINFSAFYLSCSPGSFCLDKVKPTGVHRMAVRRFNPNTSSEFFNCVFVQKYCPSSAPVFMKSKTFVQENVINCTLISHFASASGRLRPPDQLPGICPRPYCGTEFFWLRPFYTIPDLPPVNPLHCEILGMPMYASIFHSMSLNFILLVVKFWRQNFTKFSFCWGPAPDPTGGFYDVLQTPSRPGRGHLLPIPSPSTPSASRSRRLRRLAASSPTGSKVKYHTATDN